MIMILLDLRVIIRAADDRRLLCCNEQAGVSLLSEEECSQTGYYFSLQFIFLLFLYFVFFVLLYFCTFELLT